MILSDLSRQGYISLHKRFAKNTYNFYPIVGVRGGYWQWQTDQMSESAFLATIRSEMGGTVVKGDTSLTETIKSQTYSFAPFIGIEAPVTSRFSFSLAVAPFIYHFARTTMFENSVSVKSNYYSYFQALVTLRYKIA